MKDCYLVRTDDISIDDFSPSDAINENHVFDNDFVVIKFSYIYELFFTTLFIISKASF